jgi:hypothetical protein
MPQENILILLKPKRKYLVLFGMPLPHGTTRYFSIFAWKKEICGKQSWEPVTNQIMILKMHYLKMFSVK